MAQVLIADGWQGRRSDFLAMRKENPLVLSRPEQKERVVGDPPSTATGG